MVAVTVTADNFRLDDAEDIGGISSRGGGAGATAEAPLAYQGSLAWNRKGTSSTGSGFEYDVVADSKTPVDLTAANRRHWMVKHAVSDFPGLQALDGLRIYMGTGNNEYAYVTAGTDAIKAAYHEYLLRTATLIIPISPNVVGYRDLAHSSGTPTLTSIDLFGIEAAFAAPSAKSENVALDAVDIGAGLDLTGGDGADTDGIWKDFVNADEGTINNRWGYANSIYGADAILVFFGRLRIGSAAQATVFTDTVGNCIWPDGLFEAGFSRIELDVQNAGTTIVEGATHTSLGTTNVEDTRLDYAVVGTAGTATISGNKKNLRNVILTSAATVNGDLEFLDLTQGGATITNAILRTGAATGVAACDDADFTKLTATQLIQAGTGHAIEINSPGSYTLTDLNFSGYGVDGTNDAAIYNNSGGVVTLNISGGNTPSVRNGAGASSAVNNSVTATFNVTFTGTNPANYEWRLYEKDVSAGVIGTVELDGNEVETGLQIVYSYNYTVDTDVVLQVIASGFEERLVETTLSTANQTVNLTVEAEENT